MEVKPIPEPLPKPKTAPNPVLEIVGSREDRREKPVHELVALKVA
jgi:hypothetical protein